MIDFSTVILVVCSVYLLCVVLIAGMLFADMHFGLLDWRDDLGESLAYAIFLGFAGPLAVIFVFCLTGFARHGWRLTPKVRK
jgi:hypothetical protein